MAVAEMCFHQSSSVSALLRAHSWETSTLGPMSKWPSSWRVALSICLGSRFPIAILLGPELVQLYNDDYITSLGQKHPRVLGRPVQEAWPEAWHIVGPMIQGVMKTGIATWSDDLFVMINRHGYIEETYWTFSYSPIKEDTPEAAVTGMYVAVAESTSRYISDRRFKLLQTLSERTSSLLSTSLVSCETLAVLDNTVDVPFALLYLFDQGQLRLVGTSGRLNPTKAPTSLPLDTYAPWCNDLASVVNSALRSSEAWMLHKDALGLAEGEEAPKETRGIAAIPLRSPSDDTESKTPFGVLIIGLNPRRSADDAYCSFLRMIGVSLTSALVTARDHEKATQRADALAALDRAKTVFLSNISHEFRTPLTLLLGALTEMQQSTETTKKNAAKNDLHSLAMRNARRLLRLVNALLDFSRIEAGRMTAVYRPVHLLSLTRDIVSVFRAACERAHINLAVTGDETRKWQPEDTVYVDVDMWEKIITNLVSNAFNYTMRGSIKVNVTNAPHQTPPRAIVTVRDTGCGIPPKELPRIFDRFYRADRQHQPARTHEGTGIGLALVTELVRLHGGTIDAESQEGVGSTFTVQLPYGFAHLPADQISPHRTVLLRTECAPCDHEMLEWAQLDVADPIAHTSLPITVPSPRQPMNRVLLVDDNADMLAYVSRILATRHDVSTARNGREALDILQSAEEKRIELVVCDVMMPVMDGFEMIRAMRDHKELRDTPVIVLSARADESGRAEGLAAGADDYIVKPFSAVQLVASVDARIQLAQARRKAAKREKQLYEEARRANMAKDRFLAALSHELRTPLAPALLTLESLLNDERAAPVRDDLELLMQSVSLENQIIGDLLDVTRIREGKFVLQRRLIDINDLVKQTVRLLNRDIVKKQLDLRLELHAEQPYSYVDSTRVQQILWNLIGNAIKFSYTQGTITVESHNAPPLAGEASQLVLTVRDTGIGIDSAVLPRIFTAFEQGDESVTREFGGLGLGLTIAHALALMHDGSLLAQSPGRGKGATFKLSLPASLPPQCNFNKDEDNGRTSKRTRSRDAKHGGPYRILLVDDNEPTLMVMSRILSRLQYDVVSAKSVTGACGILSDSGSQFDLLLTDIGLPDGSGYDILKHAQTLGHTTRGLKALALSGYGTADDVERSMQAGFKQHLTKPISTQSLREALQSALTPVA